MAAYQKAATIQSILHSTPFENCNAHTKNVFAQIQKCRTQQAQWIDDRRSELLPINYYHVVFTLPHELNSIILGNRTQLFKLLFDASSKTLLQFGADKKYLGAIPGIISVLHTSAPLQIFKLKF